MKWLLKEWPYAALMTGVFLLLLLPIFGGLGLALTLIYLQLPLYMLHQYEEHDRDRFRTFVNSVMGGGREVLTPMAVFVINSAGVWGVDLAALYLACFVDLSFGLVAIYLPLVNAVSHIGVSVALRRYNPGLWTSVGLFLPLGLWSLAVVTEASQATWAEQGWALGAAILLHALIIAHVRLRLRALKG